MFVDSHTHLDMVINSCGISEGELMKGIFDNGVKHIVQVSVDAKGFDVSYDFARRYKEKGVVFTLGIHPSSLADKNALTRLDDFVSNVLKSEDSKLLFGIGECGLDYYRLRQNKEMQISSFEYQLALAKKWELPVIVHSREAMDDTVSILKNQNPGTGIMHCFPGDRNAAKQFLDLGFYISFAGNVTYNKAVDLHDSASYVPLDRLLIETDAPFLTPIPLRGKKNKPEYIKHTYEFIADLRKEKSENLKQNVLTNFLNIKKGNMK